MYKLFSTLIIACWATILFAQPRPTPPHFDTDAPAWAKMLLKENPNVRDIQAAYRAYFDERPFQKNKYTQFYKRWMQWARPFAQADGTLAFPTQESLLARERELQTLHNAAGTKPQESGAARAAVEALINSRAVIQGNRFICSSFSLCVG